MRFTTFLLLLVVATTACRAESVTRVRIDGDGATTLVSEFAFDDEALELIGEEGDTPEEVLDSLAEVIDPAALPVARPGVVPIRFEQGELKGLRVTFDGLSPGQIERQVTSGSSLIRNLNIAAGGGQLTVTGETRIATPSELGRLREAAPGDISEVLGITLVLEVVGPVIAHNASRVEGDLYEWDLLPAITELREVSFQLTAEVGPGFELPGDLAGDDGTAQPENEAESGTSWGAVLVGVVVAGGLGLLVVRRLLRS